MFLELHHISKSYAGHRALCDVSLNAVEGTISGLLGPNGAGKTSLIRIITRILHADAGEVLFLGRPMTDADVRQIGYLPEERGLYRKMRVEDQIIYLARLHGLTRQDALARTREWLDRFDLGAWRDKRVEQLSKGMAQKVQFIATVIHRPRLLIFDEPFSGFDPLNAGQLKDEILRLRDEGAAILFSTHNMSSVEELCHDITLLNLGEVVLQGRMADIRRQHRTHCFRVQLDDGSEFDYHLPEGQSIHDAITDLNARYPLVGFHELIPTMQQIFMNTVHL